MEAPDLAALRAADEWTSAGHRVWLATVIEARGPTPWPPGSMAALNDHGEVAGAVTCTAWPVHETRPCGDGSLLDCGRARVWLQAAPPAMLREMLTVIDSGGLVCRRVDLRSGAWSLGPACGGMAATLEHERFSHVVGAAWRLVLVGAGEIARYLAPIAASLGYRVSVIDPRPGQLDGWPHADCELLAAMPDEAMTEDPPDARTAVLALSDDPRLDELALRQASKSEAVHVRGPSAELCARTPPEIAVALAVELAECRRGTTARAAIAATAEGCALAG